MVEGRFVDCLSGNLFAVYVCYLKVEDVGLGMVVGNAVYVNCTGNMTIVFFTHFSNHLLGFPMEERLQFSSQYNQL